MFFWNHFRTKVARRPQRVPKYPPRLPQQVRQKLRNKYWYFAINQAPDCTDFTCLSTVLFLFQSTTLHLAHHGLWRQTQGSGARPTGAFERYCLLSQFSTWFQRRRCTVISQRLLLRPGTDWPGYPFSIAPFAHLHQGPHQAACNRGSHLASKLRLGRGDMLPVQAR